MKASYVNNVLSIVADVKATDTPVIVKDDNGDDAYAFSTGPNWKLTSTQFQGNTTIDGNVAIQLIISDTTVEDIINDFGDRLAIAGQYEVKAMEIAQAKAAKREADKAVVLAMFQ